MRSSVVNIRGDTEIWKDIPGYEKLYKISSSGIVRSYDKIVRNGKYNQNRVILGRNLKYTLARGGYYTVGLTKDRKQKVYFVHRLVAITFIDNPNDYPVINHKNAVRTDNRVSNLEWCTYSYNTLYSFREMGRQPVNKGERGAKSHLSKEICQIDIQTGNVVKTFIGTYDASAKTNICRSDIIRCANGKAKSAGGFKWQYK